MIIICSVSSLSTFFFPLYKKKKEKKMYNGFSSLENLNILFNNLIKIDKNNLPLKYISKLVDDLTKLLHESNYYDMEIRVGICQNFKNFKVHSSVLKARSLYFRTALSDNW